MEELRARGLCRKVGYIEQWLAARSLNGFYNNFSVVAEYDGKIPKATVYSVLRKMVLSHPLLVVNYSSSTNEIFPVDKILFRDVVECEQRPVPVDKDQLLYDVENYKFQLDSQEALFKLLVINESVLVIIFDHAFTDGGSGVNFHKYFLNTLNSLDSDELALEIDDDAVLFDLAVDAALLPKLPPSTDDSVTNVPDWDFTIKRWLKTKLPAPLKPWINDHEYSSIPTVDLKGQSLSKFPNLQTTSDHTSFFKIVNLTSAESSALIKIARSHRMTLTPILETIYLQTMVKFGLLKNAETNSYFIHSMLPINLRRFIPAELQDASAIGARVYPGIFNFVPLTDLELSYDDPELFWSLCETSFKNISSCSADQRVVMNSYAAKLANYDANGPAKLQKILSDSLANGIGGTSRFSNLGMFKSNPGKFQIQDVVFSQCMGVGGGSVVMSVVSTPTGGMNMVFSAHGIIIKDRAHIEAYCEFFKESLLKLISSEC